MYFTAILGAVLALCIHWSNAAPIAIKDASKVALSKRTVAGPQLDGANFPDPSIIFADNKWYAFGTRTKYSGIHVPVATSDDFVTWSLVYDSDGSQHDALPNLPSWAVQDSGSNTWAPDINQLDDGSFVLYFSLSTTSDTAKHCVGAATSSSVTGPFTAQDSALICPLSEGGAIDAAGYNDNGQRYIVYKVDGNSIGNGGACGNTVAPIVATPLILQPVESDGVTLSGSATTLLNNDGAADDGIIENPSLVKYDGTYYLLFSSGCFTSDGYTVSYATASSVTGPYTRASGALMDTSNSGLTSPGGADITKDGARIVFHANYGSGRALYTAKIDLAGTKISV